MSLPLPDPLIVTPRGNIGDDVADPVGVQRNFEAIAQRFPLQPQDIAEGVLKLAVTGTRRLVAFGQVTVGFPGASRFSNTVAVNHLLGATPQVAFATPAQAAFYVGGVASISPTQVSIQIGTLDGSQPANTTTVTCYWLAIG